MRLLLLAWIAACQAFLFAHSQEPLRLDIGDPWSDANVLCSINYVRDHGFLATSFTDVLDVGPLTQESYRYTHYPPLAEIVYGTLGGYLGVSSIGTYRIVALLFSAAAMLFLFLYARRMWSEKIALISVALWQGSLMWLLYADSIHQAPIFTCATFACLWGLVHAIATRQRRWYALAFVGALASFLTSYDGFIFLPAAVLVTVWRKAGNPFARGNRHFVLVCAAGCVTALVLKSAFTIGALGWHGFVADLRLQFIERSGSGFDRDFVSAVPTMTRRLTQIFSPLVWVVIVCHGWKLARARALATVRDGFGWMLLCALAFWYVFPELAASQLLPSQVLLPFYAIGAAALIVELLERTVVERALGIAWLVALLAWGAAFMWTMPRAVMRDDDVAAARKYLAGDHNDFVLDNLMTTGHVQWAFDKHDMAVYDDPNENPDDARRYMLAVFGQTHTTSATAIVYRTWESRFIDKSLWPLALPIRQWASTGMPYIYRGKARGLIESRDHHVRVGLEAVGAVKTLSLHDFDIYRIDRDTVLAKLARTPTTFLDLGGPSSSNNRMRGWNERDSSRISGFQECTHPGVCPTVLTNRGLMVPQAKAQYRAEVLVNATTACELALRVSVRSGAFVRIAMNGVERIAIVQGGLAEAVLPAQPGGNVLAFSRGMPFSSAPAIAALEVHCPTVRTSP